jgi:hypothetical protein
MTETLITCLCVTHNREEWSRWVDMQILKQTSSCQAAAIIVDSSDRAYPQDHEFRGGNKLIGRPGLASIAAKRNIALQSVETRYFAWFDDDDWSHPERLEKCVRLLEACPELVAAGPIRAYKIDARTLKSYSYRTNEHIIFNWSVYRTSYWKQFEFNEKLAVAEDTDWQNRGFRKQSYGVVNQVLGAWLCHSSNIANRADRIMFGDRFPAQLHAFEDELKSNPEYQR